MNKHNNNIDQVADAFECLICLEHATSKPIFQCSSGHIICDSCERKQQFRKCPTCEQSICEPIRNLALEKVRHFILFPCTFSDFGCRQLFRPAKKAAHEADQCMFRFVACFLKECPWFRPLHKLPDHLKEAHRKVFKKLSSKFEITVYSQTELAAEPEAEVLFLLPDKQEKYMLFVRKLVLSPPQQTKIYAFGLIDLRPDQQEEEKAAGNASFSYKLYLGNFGNSAAFKTTYEGSPLSLNLLLRLNITAKTRGMLFLDEVTFLRLLVNGSLLHIKVSLIPIITLD